MPAPTQFRTGGASTTSYTILKRAPVVDQRQLLEQRVRTTIVISGTNVRVRVIEAPSKAVPWPTVAQDIGQN